MGRSFVILIVALLVIYLIFTGRAQRVWTALVG